MAASARLGRTSASSGLRAVLFLRSDCVQPWSSHGRPAVRPHLDAGVVRGLAGRVVLRDRRVQGHRLWLRRLEPRRLRRVHCAHHARRGRGARLWQRRWRHRDWRLVQPHRR
eukprot:scaffold14055_cov114-Isochrysis_galbana.AAC.1